MVSNAVPTEIVRHGAAQGDLGSDPRLVRGEGAYTDDHDLPGQLHAAFLRSPIGAGRLIGLDTSALQDHAEVVACYTAAEFEAFGWGSFNSAAPPPGVAPGAFKIPARPVFASGAIHHIGELLAIVVARTKAAAEAGAEAIVADVEAGPAVVDVEAALRPDAPLLWDSLPGNVGYEYRVGEPEATAAAIERAAHVVHLRLVNQRLVGNPLEPRSAIAAYDPAADSYLLITGSQGVSAMRDQLAGGILHVPPNRLRVKTPDVGGGFGIKTSAYPEYAALLFASRQLHVPVKWTGTRAEAFMSDNQARDSVVEGWLALDAEGRFLGLRAEMAVALGGYIAGSGTVVGTRSFASGLAGPYKMPTLAMRSRGVMTNTLPVGPYRGAGRPEASYLVERLVDEAACRLGIDPVELRLRNLLQTSDLPYRTTLGAYYDSGDFPEMIRQALVLADWDGFSARQAAAQAQGKLRGIGIASFIEIASSATADTADLRFTDEGRVQIRSSVQSNGQDHALTFRLLASSVLQVPIERIDFIAGDSADTPGGPPTVGSRGAAVGGGTIHAGCLSAIERGKKIVSQLLEVGEADIVLEDGRYRVPGTDLAVPLLEVNSRAKSARVKVDLSMDGVEKFEAAHATFPNGCHIAEVEIDRDTGSFALVRYAAVDDVGTMINPPMVDAQIMGGIAQGFGQVSGEECIYDESGQIVTGSFMDYGMPRADDLPMFDLGFHNTPSPATALGAKGCGEAGTTGALPCIMNAINHALASVGIAPVDAPARPQRLWRALNGG